jgi:hypothetical protein
MKLRRKNKKTRFYVDNELLEFYAPILKPQGIALYASLARHAHFNTQECFPGYERIMATSGIGRRNTVSKYLKILEEEGLITVDRSRGYKSNRYYLTDVSCWHRISHLFSSEKDTDMFAAFRKVASDQYPF